MATSAAVIRLRFDARLGTMSGVLPAALKVGIAIEKKTVFQ
jgi:hypothetical protein